MTIEEKIRKMTIRLEEATNDYVSQAEEYVSYDYDELDTDKADLLRSLINKVMAFAGGIETVLDEYLEG